VFGVGCLDVSYGRFGAKDEDAHEVDGVGGVLGLVQDPVLARIGGDRRRRIADKPKAVTSPLTLDM
jgi:hypothetical protein